jgi:DNA-binding GntR family transcriptional regulator
MSPTAKTSRVKIKPLATVTHLTKQQYAYDTLRAAILNGELAPGRRLVIDDLASRFSISIIPVREALRLLQSEGLVVSVAHVGATVAAISRESVAEVFTLLEGLEVVAARTAARRANVAELDRLAAIVSAMDAALDAERPQRWAELNTRFHLAIGALAAMPMLQQMLQRAFDHWGRVRRFYFNGVLVHRARRAQAEHHLMLDHLCSKDLTSLEAVVREHNQAALDAYTAYLDSAAAPAPPAARRA